MLVLSETNAMRLILSSLSVCLLTLVACNQTTVELQSESVSVSNSAAPAKMKDDMIHIEDFVERLRTAGFEVSDREAKLYRMIMATDGGRYEVNGGVVRRAGPFGVVGC